MDNWLAIVLSVVGGGGFSWIVTTLAKTIRHWRQSADDEREFQEFLRGTKASRFAPARPGLPERLEHVETLVAEHGTTLNDMNDKLDTLLRINGAS